MFVEVTNVTKVQVKSLHKLSYQQDILWEFYKLTWSQYLLCFILLTQVV